MRETQIGKYYRAKKRFKLGKMFPQGKTIDDLFPEVPNLKIVNEVSMFPKIGIHADATEYEGYGVLGSYYLRYKRFLEYNNIPHTVIDLSKSNWLEQTKNLDILVVAYNSEPSRLNELQAKTCILENQYGVICYPSCKDMWSYEDKNRVYYLVKEHGFEHAETFVSNNREEAISYVNNAEYPFVSKIKTGSCSRGVELVKNKKRALQIVKQNFGVGRRALWTYSLVKFKMI